MQLVNRFFYEVAVSRVVTRLNISNNVEIEYFNGYFEYKWTLKKDPEAAAGPPHVISKILATPTKIQFNKSELERFYREK